MSKKEMLEHAREGRYTAKEFSAWARSLGYSPKLVLSLTQEYMEKYQHEGTSKKHS
jgi:hypothetical protein